MMLIGVIVSALFHKKLVTWDERCDLISSFEKVIQDMNKLGKYDLQMFYMRNMNTYLNLERQKKA